MRTLVRVLICVTLSASISFAGGEKKYGKRLTTSAVTKVSEILAEPGKFNGKRVRVEGAVVDVCSMRGCWIKISGDKEFDSIRFKVDDGVIVFPMDAKGKRVSAEGVVSVKTTSVEDQIKEGEHMAKEEGKAFDPATVKGPKTVIQIQGDGAVIR
jgi:hypothetical protein